MTVPQVVERYQRKFRKKEVAIASLAEHRAATARAAVAAAIAASTAPAAAAAAAPTPPPAPAPDPLFDEFAQERREAQQA